MEFDNDKVDEAVLALLWMNSFKMQGENRAWKGFDWDSTDRLHAKGLIGDPKSKVKSVVLTEEGARRGEELCRRLFGR